MEFGFKTKAGRLHASKELNNHAHYYRSLQIKMLSFVLSMGQRNNLEIFRNIQI